ncbi:VOC family protein [Nocardia sp. NPDC003482]
MHIREVTITATDLDENLTFYRDVLNLPVDTTPSGLRITIGTSRLVITQGPEFDGVHHLAFDIPPQGLDLAYTWLRDRLDPIRVNGEEIVDGPPGWSSRSIYFRGPDDIVLEYIARQAHSHERGADGRTPRLLSISEIGIGVADLPAAVATLDETFALPHFPPQLPTFAPLGDHDGLLILADTDRIWFATESDHPARGPINAILDIDGRHTRLALDPRTELVAA